MSPIPGVLGIIGGFCYFIAGIRILFFGGHEDWITDALGIAWALAWVFAGWAILAWRITGSSRVARGVSAVLVAGFATAVLWGVHRLIDRPGANAGPFAIAPLVVVLGMLGTGVFTLQAAPWSRWRRSVPLIIALVYIASIVMSGISARVTLGHAFTLAGLGYMLLGDSVRRHAEEQ